MATGAETDAEVGEQHEVDRVRAQIGKSFTPLQHNTVVTVDNIRHYVHGYGDDNPLFDYRAGATPARDEDIEAPATFLLSCGFPRTFGLRGFHGLFAGVDLRTFFPIKPGMRITASTHLSALEERQGSYAGRSYIQRFMTNYTDQDDRLVGILESYAFRTKRSSGAKSKKYRAEAPARYDENQIEGLRAEYLAERDRRQGPVPRHFEDVEVGEALPPLIKGPLTVTDNIAWTIGFGPVYVMAHRLWYQFLHEHPGAATTNEFGVPDVPERVHWDNGLAASIGLPGAYDYGPQRIAWLGHAATDWMGDQGKLTRIAVRLSAPNYVGDVTRINGSITGKCEDARGGLVTAALDAVDQRGRTTATAEVELVLPAHSA